MIESLPSPDDLILHVETSALDADPLHQLTESIVVSGQMSNLADELVGHFVERARSSNATWEEIGECMGVSKQAAQKRFNTGGGSSSRAGFFLTKLDDEARQAVHQAVSHARQVGSSHVGTDHLVLGLLDDPASVGGRAIVGLGGPVENIRSAALSGAQPNRERPPLRGHIPFSPDCKKVLELALREAIRSGDRRIGTTHIILGILRDPESPGALVLSEYGIERKAVEAWLEA